MALQKKDIKPPVLPKEAVQVDELGGEVIVRGLLLRERVEIFHKESGATAWSARVSQILAATVIDADGKPIYTADEWEEFGAVHFSACARLLGVANRLSGLEVEETQKN